MAGGLISLMAGKSEIEMNFKNNIFNLRILTKEEYREYFHLLKDNRDHLKDFFPGTLKAAATLELAQDELIKMEESYKGKQLYPFGIFIEELLIGYACIKNIDWRVPKGELGYFVAESHQGKGIISEAIKEIINHAFNELKMEKLFIRTGPQNIGSQKIALKNGFQKEGVLRSEFRVSNGELIDTVYFGKLRSDIN